MTLNKTLPVILLAGLLVLFGAFLYSETIKAHASALDTPATVATTSVIAVSNTQIPVFATSTCASRIISTQASPIMIGFTDAQGFLPSGLQGFLQAASTTVSYPADQYGCKTFRIFGYAATNITVSESR